MKNIIRNLALGLTLTLPSLASAQLGISWLNAPDGSPVQALAVDNNGNVGINGDVALTGFGARTISAMNRLHISASELLYLNPWAGSGSVIVGGGGGPGSLIVTGVADVRGKVTTPRLEVTGGADIAEMFKSKAVLEPGTVASADPEHEGQVHAASTPYDEAVIGIVSGAGGIQPAQTLRQPGTLADGNIPVSTGGRVWCKCDASYGSIKPGALLTPSATPGHAMKVSDKTRAQGAILGKALTSLAEGRGVVLVWVTHQ